MLLVVALTSIALTLWVTWQLEGGAAAVNEAGRMRMQTWRLNSTAQAKNSETQVADLVAEFDHSLSLPRTGDPGRLLFMPMDDKVNEHFSIVQNIWSANRGISLGATPPDMERSLAVTAGTVAAVVGLVTAIEHQLSRLTAVFKFTTTGKAAKPKRAFFVIRA